jgi:hypothetical protein
MKEKKLQKNRGFVILYAVTLAAILLSIALGVASIALKEINFTISAKDTNDAFFAADTGAECALFNDKSTIALFIDPNSPTITCNNHSVVAVESPTSFWTFYVMNLGSEGLGCSYVTVDKTNSILTTIISKGYSSIISGSTKCEPGVNAVEREIKVSY